jgi:mono/diheme cytochrome c family protein
LVIVLRTGLASLLILVMEAALVACSAGAAPAAGQSSAAPTVAGAQATLSTAAPAAAPASWADVFPAGAGKQTALERCGSCHGFDRLVLGQKTADRWASVKASHSDKVSGMSDADQNALYTYLAQNFGPDKPEPNITGLPVTSAAE